MRPFACLGNRGSGAQLPGGDSPSLSARPSLHQGEVTALSRRKAWQRPRGRWARQGTGLERVLAWHLSRGLTWRSSPLARALVPSREHLPAAGTFRAAQRPAPGLRQSLADPGLFGTRKFLL